MEQRAASLVTAGLDGPPRRLLCQRTTHLARRMLPKEWRKWWKEELGQHPASERTCVAGVGFSHSIRVSLSLLLYSTLIKNRVGDDGVPVIL